MPAKKTVLLTALLLVITSILLSCLLDNGTFPDIADILPAVSDDARTQISDDIILNDEATIPPQCYTKTEDTFNPCYTCHQLYDRTNGEDRLNALDDGSLQGGYMFSDIGITNHWKNLFVDRSAWLEEVSDKDIRHYIASENYTALPKKLKNADWKGFIPDLKNYHLSANAFDANGLAKDGSHWVAFNYKPFPGTFWPTNGSTDDVVIRLPKAFRERNGQYDRDVYFANLTLVELNLKNMTMMELWAIDENQIGHDLDINGTLGTTTQIKKGTHYIGDAQTVALEFQQFPAGTELMHSVRYVGVKDNNEIVIPPRMKELRYMKKVNVLPRYVLESRYANERKEKLLGQLPNFIDLHDEGFDNGQGWYLQGFIEDYDGSLRPQSYEERLFCMGCHSAIGTTIDSTFSFARKVDGKKGWQYINLHGMVDAPSFSEEGGEILNYLKRSGGGNEFRANPEMVSRWYNDDGSIKESDIRNTDVYDLITPSPERALQLNKAYSHIVRHQSYIEGRDATWIPATTIFTDINEDIPPLDQEHQFYQWDIRLKW
jgi:hypothetical protein